MDRPANFLCVSTYFKGVRFLEALKATGNNVYLLTKKNLENEAWPWESIDDVFYVDDWNEKHINNGIAFKFRSIHFDRFIALDDFDVERVASLREHFRMPGMGQTTGRHFRDKLAMRLKAQESDITVPPFSTLFNDEVVNQYADSINAPWAVKPRDEASATGIKKVHSKDELWKVLDQLGDDRHRFLIEKFEPGDVYHVDSLVENGKVIFAQCSRYLDTPFEVAHGGGIFRSVTIKKNSKEEKQLQQVNKNLLSAFGLKYGASHTEFIRSKATGEFLFLETASRVGGANIAEMVEYASGINLWEEWAKIESAQLRGYKYKLPKVEKRNTGIVVSLSRYEYPDYSSFSDSDIMWKMIKPWHIGMIVSGDSVESVENKLAKITERIASEFHASLPPPDTLHE